MLNVVNTKLENKTDKQFIYYIGNSKIILDPAKPVIINGEIFTKETRQEGNTENLLVNIYNGNIDFTLIIDQDFVTNIERGTVVALPKRAESRLVKKVSPVSEKKPEVKKEEKVEPVKVETPKEEKKEIKSEPVVEVKKETKVKPEVKKEEPKKEEPKKESAKPAEDAVSLDNITVEDTKGKSKKVTKL